MMRSTLPVLILAVAVTATHATTFEPALGVTLPDEVAGLSFAGKKEFPQKELGVNYAWQRNGPTRGSVFIYTAGAKAIPDGTEAPIVRRHFDQVIGEVQQMATIGRARSVTLSGSSEQVTHYSGCGPQFIWRGYEIVLDEGSLTSYTYVTGLKNNFVKLRISHLKGDAQAAKDTERFVQEIRKVLGGCK
ncbi:hypothetical protein ACQ859_30020 [Roseateles chitinivorans]|uniref:hypothetical protein n=1 Tax=Roseateles chitinivorans TaxID=2917965 RepID=UPI003D66F937